MGCGNGIHSVQGTVPGRQAECTIRALCLQIYRASAGNVRRSKEETEADQEEEDEFGYTRSEYRHCYFTQAVFVDASSFVCVVFGAFACHCVLFSHYCCVAEEMYTFGQVIRKVWCTVTLSESCRCRTLLIISSCLYLTNIISLVLIKRSNLMQQYADIYLLQGHSTCLGCHSTHHQEH